MRAILCGLVTVLALFCSLTPLRASVVDDSGCEDSMNSRILSMRPGSIVAHFAFVLEEGDVRYTKFPLYLREGPNSSDIYGMNDKESVRALSFILVEPASCLDDTGEPSHYKLFLSRAMDRNTIILPCLFKGAKIHYALTSSKEFDDWMDFCVRIEGNNGAIYRLESWLFPLEGTEESVVRSEVFDDYFTTNAVLGVMGSKERLPIDQGSFMIDPKENLIGSTPHGLTFSLVLKQLRPHSRDPLRIDVEPLPFKRVDQGVYETDSLSNINPYLDGVTFKVDIKTLSGESYVSGPNQDNTYELMNNDVRAYSSLYFVITSSTTHFYLSARAQLSPLGGERGGGLEESEENFEESLHRHIASFPISLG
jgi:hypothetical protein